MGIKSNYTKCIRAITNDSVYRACHISEFAYKKVAVDTSIYIYKFKAAMGESWLNGFLNLVSCLRSNLVHPCFIFDGKPPVQKEEEQQARRNERDKLMSTNQTLMKDIDLYYESGEITEGVRKLAGDGPFDIRTVEERMDKKNDQVVHVKSEDFDTLKILFEACKIPYYVSLEEAEKLCSKMCIDGVVDAVLTDDSDVIAYGTPISISRLNTRSGGCFVMDSENLRTRMGMTESQILDHCIMCGTDYNKNISGIGAMTAYKHIKTYGSIDLFAANTNTDVSILNHIVGRTLFTQFAESPSTVPYCGSIDLQVIEKVFHQYNINYNPSYFISRTENKYLDIK
jgi:5'-3' exonuclease